MSKFVDQIRIISILTGIPGADGSVARGSRQMNFVWYNNFPEGQESLERVMTDIHVW